MTHHGGKDLPAACWLVEGGGSNFPLAVLHNHLRIPRAPAFGVTLGQPQDRPRPVRSMTNRIARISTTDHTAKRDADGNRPDPDGLNFRRSDEAKIDLFRSGALAAAAALPAP